MIIIDRSKETKLCACCGETKNWLVEFSPKSRYCRACNKAKGRASKIKSHGSFDGPKWGRFCVAQKDLQRVSEGE